MIEQKLTSTPNNYSTLQGFGYWDLSRPYYNTDHFLGNDHLNFTSATGYLCFTGNELLQYPTLAKALRAIPEYPQYNKSYPVTDELHKLTGLSFFIAFAEYVKTCDADFAQDVAAINAKVNNLIYLHGVEKTKPIITKILRREPPHEAAYGLMINGIDYQFADYRNKNLLNVIDLQRLIDRRAYNADYVGFHAVLLGSPYLALRVAKTWKHAGRVVWYDLDKMAVISTAEINAIKKKSIYQEAKGRY